MIASPVEAPPRPDLDWLRHRTRRGVPAAVPPTGGGTGGSTALADFLAGRTTRRRPQPAPAVDPTPVPVQRPAPVQPPAPAPAARVDDLDLSGDPLDLSAPAPPASPPAPAARPASAPVGGGDLDLSDDLDLSAPTPPQASPPAPRPGSSSDLDLSAPQQQRPAAPPASADLDLFPEPAAPAPSPAPSGADLDLFPDPVPAAATRPGPAAAPARPAPVVRSVPRVAPGARVILTLREPTVTLDRLQSGIGGLTVTAVCSPAVGDLVLGAVYQLADGTSGVLGAGTGITTAPPRSRRPVLQGGRDEFEHISVDLRQARSLRRFVVWATSATEQELAWGGTLRLATHGGSRVEIPLDVGRHVGPLVVASVYVLDGEFVVRAELDPVHGVARDVARAYGFGAITWADPRTPVL